MYLPKELELTPLDLEVFVILLGFKNRNHKGVLQSYTAFEGFQSSKVKKEK